MPKLLSESEIRLEWSDLKKIVPKRKPKNVHKRSSGWHLSGINSYALKAAGLLNTEDETDEYPLRMAVGTAMEDYLVGFYPDMVWQPGEFERDGVFCTPDGLSEDNPHGGGEPSETVIEEFKGATWKSRFKRKGEAILSERIWMWQLAGECAILRQNYCRLHAVYINGDYRCSGPQFFQYLIYFSDE